MTTVPRSLRFKVLERDAFTCRYCGANGPGVKLEVDHVHPKSKGGRHEEDNLVTACFECNRGKRAQVMDVAANSTITMPPVEGWASLDGKFIHLKGEDGLVHQQGRILAFYGEYVSIQWFEWLTGHSSNVTLEHMPDLMKRGLYLYRTAEDMREAWEYFFVPRKNYDR